MQVPCLPIWLGAVAILVTGAAARHARAEDRPIKVTVIAILGSEKKDKIDKELKQFAAELQKKDPALKGFVIERTTCATMKVGATEKFPLIGDQEVEIHLRDKNDKDNRVSLTIKPPTLGEISYTTCCGKFFPVMTRYVTKDDDRLFIAIMVKPCDGKK